jgi:hypothetical protein
MDEDLRKLIEESHTTQSALGESQRCLDDLKNYGEMLGEQIAAAIAEGKSTGDRAMDLAFRLKKFPDLLLVDRIRAIEKQLCACRGQLVALQVMSIHTTRSFAGYEVWRSPPNNIFKFGVLAGEQLVVSEYSYPENPDFKRLAVVVPCRKVISAGRQSGAGVGYHFQTEISPPYDRLMLQELLMLATLAPDDDYQHTLFVGDEQVRGCCSDLEDLADPFTQVCRLLGYEPSGERGAP